MSQPTNKEWMNERNRVSKMYTEGVEGFIDFVIENNVHQFSTFPCPCVKCRNRKRLNVLELRNHLIRNGVDKTYTLWVLHGEKSSSNLAAHAVMENTECEEKVNEENIENVGLENLVDACYGVHEKAYVDIEGSQRSEPEETYVGNKKYNEYKRLATEKLYPSCEGPDGVSPKGIDPNVWRKFCDNGSNQKKKDQKDRNAENRRMLKYSHTLGRCTYAQKGHLMVEANPEEVKRVEKWFVAHEDKNGNALASSKAYYDKLKNAVEKRKNINGEDSNISEDYDNDALTEVFGKDKKGQVRAIGSHVSKKQLMHLGVANAKFEQQKKTVEGVDALKEDIISSVKTQFVESNTMFEAKFQAMLGTMQTLMNMITSSKEDAPQPMLRSEFASNSSHLPLHFSQNIENIFASCPSQPRVILLDKYGEELAKGYVVTDATKGICHGKRIGLGEKKVYVEEVLKPDAGMWDSPQDGNYTLADYVQGGFLVWMESWLKYI